MDEMIWINLSEKKPLEDKLYLVHVLTLDPNKPYINTAWYDPNYGWSLLPEVFVDSITHWMHLPKPPDKMIDEET